jgi:hypothetical protein
MKLIVDVEKLGSCVDSVKISCTPVEALVLNHAMRLFADNAEMHEMDKDVMKRMLEDFAEGIDQACEIMQRETKDKLSKLSSHKN